MIRISVIKYKVKIIIIIKYYLYQIKYIIDNLMRVFCKNNSVK